MTKQLRGALIGCGAIGQTFADAIATLDGMQLGLTNKLVGDP